MTPIPPTYCKACGNEVPLKQVLSLGAYCSDACLSVALAAIGRAKARTCQRCHGALPEGHKLYCDECRHTRDVSNAAQPAPSRTVRHLAGDTYNVRTREGFYPDLSGQQLDDCAKVIEG